MKKYLGAEREQFLLLPPDVEEWVPKNHISRRIIHFLARLDLKAFYDYYETQGAAGGRKGPAGRPPYDPRMMLALLFYAMYKGARSSRQMEELVRSDLGARMIAGGKILPDHSIFAAFRKRHAPHMKQALAQVILLCAREGLVDLEHVSIDSTIIKANASKNRQLKLEKLQKEYEAAKALAEKYLDEANQADASEQKKRWNKAKRAEKKAEGLEEALDFLRSQITPDEKTGVTEEETAAAKEQRSKLAAELKSHREKLGLSRSELQRLSGIPRRRLADYESGARLIKSSHIGPLEAILQWAIPDLPKLRRGRKKRKASGIPADKASVNTTDRSAYFIGRRKKPFVLGYLPQIAVCGKNQIIVAAGLAPTNNDEPFLATLVREAEALLDKKIKIATADSGYWGEGGKAIQTLTDEGRTVLCPPRGKRMQPAANPPSGSQPEAASVAKDTISRMRSALATPEGKAIYNRRSGIVEPVNARIKGLMRVPRFLTRGAINVFGEFCAYAAMHNFLKLVRAGAV